MIALVGGPRSLRSHRSIAATWRWIASRWWFHDSAQALILWRDPTGDVTDLRNDRCLHRSATWLLLLLLLLLCRHRPLRSPSRIDRFVRIAATSWLWNPRTIHLSSRCHAPIINDLRRILLHLIRSTRRSSSMAIAHRFGHFRCAGIR